MKEKDIHSLDTAEIRKQAEEITNKLEASISEDEVALSKEEKYKLLHELRVHQIELEMQNEELRSAQEELVESRTRYFNLYEFAPVSYCTLSDKGIILEANLTAATMLGLDRSKLVKQPFSRFILPADQDIHYVYRRKLINSSEPQEYELRMLKPDGTIYWVHLTATSGLDDDRIPIIRIVLIDITERKRADELQLFLAQTSSGNKEEPFFYALARYLAYSLDMFYVCIDRLEGDGLNATTVSVWCDGHFEDNVTYALKDTPCGDVVGKTVCCFPASVCKYFPRDQVLQDLKAESYIGVTVFSHTGEPIGLIAVIGRNPITNRKLAEDTLNYVCVRVAGELERLAVEEALRESEERFKALHNASFGGIAIHDNGVILDCNQGLSEMMGYTREELITMDGYLLIAPDSRQLILDKVKADYHKPYEAFGLRKNGEIFPMRLEARSIPYKGKTVRSVEFRDLTEQKIAEKKLRESEEDLKESQRIANIGNWHLDVASNEVVWSEELYRMYGFDPSLPPPPYTEHQKLFTPESWDRLSAALAKTAETGIPYEMELNTIREDGSCGWMWVHGSVVLDETGKTIGLKGVAQDISERKHNEQEKEKLQSSLDQARKMDLVGQLAGGVAHDFNNLLTVIMGYSAELCNSLPPDSQFIPDIEEILKAGKRAKDLTQQLLTFSRKQMIQAMVLDLNVIISNLDKMLRRLIGEHIELVNMLANDHALIMADSGQMEQVIINLVVNSRDAMPKGGKITVQTSIFVIDKANETSFQADPGKYVLLSVTDNGKGMDKSTVSKVFEPFFTTKEKGSGLGLGLSTVYGIVMQSGGKLSVESEPGKGTCIQVLLPYATPETNIGQKPRINTETIGKGEQILIVEDEESLCLYFNRMISRLGYKVTTAHSGAEALSLLAQGLKPELLITDVIMPGMNGQELADQVRLNNPEQKLMFMSGFTDDIITPFGVLNPGIHFIQKPFSSSEIAARISAVLNDSPKPQSKKLKILMLDDEKDILVLVKRVSNKRGHEFTGVEDVDAALQALNMEKYDILLVDVNLVCATGMEALQSIREAGHNLPAIAISGSLNPAHKEAMQALGVARYMEKSFELVQLIVAAEEVVMQLLPSY